jgi:hypothetical protein
MLSGLLQSRKKQPRLQGLKNTYRQPFFLVRYNEATTIFQRRRSSLPFMSQDAEGLATVPIPVAATGFNISASLPYGCTIQAIQESMQDFLNFIGFINQQLYSQSMPRLESLLMSANFSSVVSEYMNVTIPRHCSVIVKNGWHNGHPDLLPRDVYPNNAAQHAPEGIEVKASRYLKGWQGHNPEDVWLLIFVFDSNRPNDFQQGITPRPFRFIKVVGAQLEKADWQFSGRSATSRRTITASVTATGYAKLEQNWIYYDPSYQHLADTNGAEAGPNETG